MTDIIEKMLDEILEDPEAKVSFDGMRSAASVLLREMMEPSDEMNEAFANACDDSGQVMSRYGWRVMLKAFAQAHSINIEDE